MATERAERTITVEPGSALARALEEAKGKPVVLVKDGLRLRVTPEDIWTSSDPERVREALRRSAEALSPDVAAALKAEIRVGRGHVGDDQASR